MSKTAQQQWNEKHPEILKKASKDFYQKHKQIKIEVNKQDHSDLIEWYEQLDKNTKKRLRSQIETEVLKFLYRQKKSFSGK